MVLAMNGKRWQLDGTSFNVASKAWHRLVATDDQKHSRRLPSVMPDRQHWKAGPCRRSSSALRKKNESESNRRSSDCRRSAQPGGVPFVLCCTFADCSG